VAFADGITISHTPTTHVGETACIAALRAQVETLKRIADQEVIYAKGSLWGMSGGMLEFIEVSRSGDRVELVFTCHDHPEHRYRIKVAASDYLPAGDFGT
jgi:hypothetical protein